MTALLPGLAEPTRDAQAIFRAVLAAMASPGSIVTATAPCPPGLSPSSAAVLLCLADADTAVWLQPAHAAARAWLAFHAGTPFADKPADAAFVVADGWPPADDLDAGSDEAPEASATLILHVAGLGCGPAWELDGPGLAAPTPLAVTGLPDDFAAIWSANRARFPRGFDLILCAGDRLAAIARGIRVSAL